MPADRLEGAEISVARLKQWRVDRGQERHPPSSPTSSQSRRAICTTRRTPPAAPAVDRRQVWPAGEFQLALGTQTIGSVIRPATFCGIVGFKPSYDRIPSAGTVSTSQSLDHVGLFPGSGGHGAGGIGAVCRAGIADLAALEPTARACPRRTRRTVPAAPAGRTRRLCCQVNRLEAAGFVDHGALPSSPISTNWSASTGA
ncbi:MAG: amidase family protein [Caldilineaceae bacterium]